MVVATTGSVGTSLFLTSGVSRPPQMTGVEEVVINREVIEGRAKPLQIYADRRAETAAGSSA